MSGETSREPSPREKLQRVTLLARRAPAFWRGALVLSSFVFALGIVSILRLPRIYQSETVVLVRDAIRTDPNDDSPRVQAQRLGPKVKDLLLARSRLEKVIQDLGLYDDVVERFGMLDAVEEMRTQIGFRARDSDMFVISFQSQDRDLAQRVTAYLAESMIDEFVRDNVNRARIARDFLADEEKRAEQELEDKGRALAAFLANHPQFAWDPTRGFPSGPAQVPSMGAPLGGSGKTSSDPELSTLQRERARLEEKLAAGAAQNDFGKSGPLRLLEEARSKAQAALAQAQAELVEKRQKLTEEHPDVIAARNRAILAGRSLGEAETALARAQASVKEDPSYASASNADAKIREQLAAIKAAIAARERALSSAGRPNQGAATPKPKAESGAVELETEWQRLVREVSEARSHKEDVANKRARAELAASATASSGSMLMTVIDPAYRPTRPVKPKRMVLGGMTFGLSAMLGVLWAFARVLLDDVIFDATDIEAKGSIRMLVAIPRDPMEKSRTTGLTVRRDSKTDVAIHRTVTPPPSPEAKLLRLAASGENVPIVLAKQPMGIAKAQELESPPDPVEVVGFASPRLVASQGELPLIGPRAIAALRILRHRIEQHGSDGHLVVGVTSAVSKEGKSRLAIQLTLALAESARASVLLVEANLERPSLATLLGIEIPEGRGFSLQMRQRAVQGATTPWGVVACGGTMHLLAENPRDPAWPGMLHSRELRLAIDELRPRYDYIVIDGPSILEEGGATSIERVADGMVIVARARVTRGASLARAAGMLGNERIFGVVLTDVEEET